MPVLREEALWLLAGEHHSEENQAQPMCYVLGKRQQVGLRLARFGLLKHHADEECFGDEACRAHCAWPGCGRVVSNPLGATAVLGGQHCSPR